MYGPGRAVFCRVWMLLSRWAGALFAPAEDPREYPVSDRERQVRLLAQVREAGRRVQSVQEQLEYSAMTKRADLPRLVEQARQLIRLDREETARLILQRRQTALEQVRLLEGLAEQVSRDAQTLATLEERLRSSIIARSAQEDAAAARVDAAEARATVSEALTGISADFTDLRTAIRLTNERAEHIRARADAIDELVDLGVLDWSGGAMDRHAEVGRPAYGGAEDVEALLRELEREEKAVPAGQ